jgi:hypothetical protein
MVAQDTAAGVVVSYGKAAAEAAQWWANILGRPAFTIEGISDLAAYNNSPGILIVASDSVFRIQWLTQLAVWSVRNSVGVGVVRADPRAARRHKLLSSIVSRRLPVLAYSQLWDGATTQLAGDATLFGRLGAASFVERMLRPAEAVLLETHGNGADMQVGEQVLCSKVSAQATPALGTSLPCFSGGLCLRGVGPSQEPLRFIDPSRMSADVVIMSTCWGVVPADGLIHTQSSIASLLLSSGWSRALIAPFKNEPSRTSTFVDIAVRYMLGVPLGQLTLELNREEVERYGDSPSWVLFGDPCARGSRRLRIGTAGRQEGGWSVGISDSERAFAVRLPGASRPAGDYRIVGSYRGRLLGHVGRCPGRHAGDLLLTGLAHGSLGAKTVTVAEGGVLTSDDDRARSFIQAKCDSRSIQAVMARQLGVLGPMGSDSCTALARRLEDAALGLVECSPRDPVLVDPEASAATARMRVMDGADLDRELSHFLMVALTTNGGASLVRWPYPRKRCIPAGRHGCGGYLSRVWRVCTLFPAASRMTWICQSCGLIADTPAGSSRPSLKQLSEGKLELRTGLPRRVSPVVMTTVGGEGSAGNFEEHRVRFADHKEVRGRATLSLADSTRLPRSRQVAVAVVWDGEFAVVRAPN